MNIERLPQSPKAFRIDLVSISVTGFENLKAAADEDDQRARLAKRTAKAHPEISEPIKRLRRAYKTARGRRSLASARCMRLFRIIVIGWIWQLVVAWGKGVSTVTLIPRTWIIPVGELSSVDPSKLIEQLRRQLQRCGSSVVDGFLIGFLHGEFEPIARCYHVHFHGIVAGGMRAVVDRLRTCRNYACRYDEAAGREVKGVRRSKSELSNLPRPLTYALQSFWAQRWRGKNVDGKPLRGSRYRIPEPYHSELLIWLHRWTLADITLMMKLRVTPNGFVLTAK